MTDFSPWQWKQRLTGLATGCPMCQANLDTRQEEIGEGNGEEIQSPILYFTELMGLALGHRDTRNGFTDTSQTRSRY